MNTLVILTAKYLIFVMLLIAGIYWLRCTTKDKIYLAVVGGMAGAIGLIFIKLAGKLYYDPRPFVSHHLQPLIAHAADNGFPSDHTTLAAVIALVVMTKSRKLGTILLIMAVLVGASRVAAHVHSPIDIVGGILIALAATAIAYYAAPFVITKFKLDRYYHE